MLTGENILAGLITGVAAGVQPGPLLALVVRESSRHGFRAGARVALAPLFSDGPIVLLALLVQRNFAARDGMFSVLAAAAAIYCLWLAWQTMNLPFQQATAEPLTNQTLLQAASVNLLNPNPWLFWLTIGVAHLYQGVLAGAAFVTAFMTAIVATKIGFSWLVAKSARGLQPRLSQWLSKMLAAALVLFAMRLFKQALTGP